MPARLAVALALTVLSFGTSCKKPTPAPTVAPTAHAETVWRGWEPAVFAAAKSERKIILVDVIASWCHWCHVMDEETYADPEVAALLAEHFVAIRVDSDARPDVAERYADWGWPATAFLTSDARPVLELRGYQDPREFAALLRRLVADHWPRTRSCAPTCASSSRSRAATTTARCRCRTSSRRATSV